MLQTLKFNVLVWDTEANDFLFSIFMSFGPGKYLGSEENHQELLMRLYISN